MSNHIVVAIGDSPFSTIGGGQILVLLATQWPQAPAGFKVELDDNNLHLSADEPINANTANAFLSACAFRLSIMVGDLRNHMVIAEDTLAHVGDTVQVSDPEPKRGDNWEHGFVGKIHSLLSSGPILVTAKTDDDYSESYYEVNPEHVTLVESHIPLIPSILNS
jgi:hypothetical protein